MSGQGMSKVAPHASLCSNDTIRESAWDGTQRELSMLYSTIEDQPVLADHSTRENCLVLALLTTSASTI